MGVVSCCDQEGGCGFGADPRSGQQRRVGPGAELFDFGVELLDLVGECLMSAGQQTQCFLGIGDSGLRLCRDEKRRRP